MIKKFLKPFTDSGFLLILGAILALGIANSQNYAVYQDILSTQLPFSIFGKSLSLQLLVNDGLMTLFFLLVGLEIKREFLYGELNSKAKAGLPVAAAIGGMVVPALIYLAVTRQHPEFFNGWAIASATDIAFSLAILSLLGSRVPVGLKVFLTALAIIDDLGAIIIIAGFYTHSLNWIALGGALASMLILAGMNRMRIHRLPPYLIAGAALWVFMLHSGIHPTLAGVLVAACIPAHSLQRLEQILHPCVAYVILPLFALFNSGLRMDDIGIADFYHPVTLGIIAGLFFGKAIGIFSASWIYVRASGSRLPAGCDWRHIYGASILGGIGFTMSLFIGALAFTGPSLLESIKLGVLTGSLLSAGYGYMVLQHISKTK